MNISNYIPNFDNPSIFVASS